MLCTLEPRLSIYHTKMLVGSLYLLFFSLAETAMIPILANIYEVRQPLPYYNLGVFFLSTFIVSFVLMLIQQPLSLMSSNQLFPIFFGIGGTFVGLFSWFFPNINLRYFLPWGYYCVGTTINMDYDEATRIVTYYTIPFPIKFFLCFLLFGIIVYLFGRRQFMKKEV